MDNKLTKKAVRTINSKMKIVSILGKKNKLKVVPCGRKDAPKPQQRTTRLNSLSRPVDSWVQLVDKSLLAISN